MGTIQYVPDPPPGLLQAAKIGKVVPFVGAGASRLAGCPNWHEFADRTLGFFVGAGKFSHAQLSQIGHLNPRVKLSIALSLAKEHNLKIPFDQVLYPTGQVDHSKGSKLYEGLSKLGKTFVTTNYDKWLDTAVGQPSLPSDQQIAHNNSSDTKTSSSLPSGTRRAIYNVRDFTAHNLDQPDTVIHLHGSMDDASTMVMTTRQYVDHYHNDRRSGDDGDENFVLTFLTTLFTQKTVLFVGYGLEELEILEYAIGKARQAAGKAGEGREIRHYLIQGFFSHEEEVMRNLAIYYAESGIGLIPFLRDQKNWDQLIDVVENFARHMPAADQMKIERLRSMEAMLTP